MSGGKEPLDAARAFVDAVLWGEHRTVWDLLALEGRKTVLRVAVGRGMDEVLASRLREGAAGTKDENEFLTDLVNGLRADLAGTDLDALEYELDPGPQEQGRARVALTAPMPPELGGGLPVGSVELSRSDDGWRIERLMPRLSR